MFGENKFNSFYSLKNEDVSSVTCFFAPSKSFNFAELNCSYTITKNRETKEKMEIFLHSFSPISNLIGEQATYAAYTKGEEWLSNTLQKIQDNFDFAQNFIGKNLPDLTVTPSKATYLMWVDCSLLKEKDPYQFFLQKAKVAFRHAKDFGKGYSQYIRINLACDKDLLEKALHCILVAVKSRE